MRKCGFFSRLLFRLAWGISFSERKHGRDVNECLQANKPILACFSSAQLSHACAISSDASAESPERTQCVQSPTPPLLACLLFSSCYSYHYCTSSFTSRPSPTLITRPFLSVGSTPCQAVGGSRASRVTSVQGLITQAELSPRRGCRLMNYE